MPQRAFDASKLRVILLAAIASVIVEASAQAGSPNDIYRIPETMLTGETADTVIVFERRYVRIVWDSAAPFTPPYSVLQLSLSGDTLFRAETMDNWFALMTNAGDGKGSSLEVVSAGGSRFRMEMEYRVRPIPKWLWPVVALGAVMVVLCVVIWLLVRRQRRELDQARKELEESESGTRKSRKYEFVTVLFADIQGFTQIAAHTDPEKLVDELDRYFIYFDELVDRYGVEKIKTIGDAYMCAGGVPDIDSANPIEVVMVGLEMIAYVEERRASKEGFWNIRVGVNTGPVMSAHLGNIKKVFDIWGDTVNTASRMESGGEAGRVNISEMTYQRVRDFFDCEYRGKMPVKYKGEMDMYFVNRLKEEYCQPGTTYRPNATLLRKLQMLRIHDFEERLHKILLNDANPNISKRFDALMARVRILATMEGFTDDETIVCCMAAIFSFVQSNFAKEVAQAGKMEADKILTRMRMSEELREEVRRVYLHQQQGKAPEGRIEEVLVDSINEVYGRKDIVPCLLAIRDEKSDDKIRLGRFFAMHRSRLESFSFYTNSARKLAEAPKNRQLEILDEMITD